MGSKAWLLDSDVIRRTYACNGHVAGVGFIVRREAGVRATAFMRAMISDKDVETCIWQLLGL